MLDYYIYKQIPIGSSIILYVDNCFGQNENQSFIGYLADLVKIAKRLRRVELDFMVVGYTKFSADSHISTLR